MSSSLQFSSDATPPDAALQQPDPVLTVRGVGKTYAAPVLADVSLQLHAGEVLALTGENLSLIHI